MKKGGGVLSVIGGAVGIVESVILILGAAIGLRFGDAYSALSFVMGWVGLVFSLALVLLGSLVLRSSQRWYGLMSLACACVGVLLASGVFVTILLTGPTTKGISLMRSGSTTYTSEALGVLWSSGWYIGIFLVLGVVGGVLATLGTTTRNQELNEPPSEKLPSSDT
ncbi:MAG: hypothetical protein OXG08_02015 [Gammaproteobacteria bacterium]|nr:hypothetical protein [Gammaproteobacteria bacterium]